MLTILLANRDSNAEIIAPEIQIQMSLSADAEGDILVIAPEIQISIDLEADLIASISAPEILLQFGISAERIWEFEIAFTQLQYFLTITGSEDGTTDVDLPCSSFQSRRRSGAPTYLQVVIPSLDYNNYLNDRPNGKMIVSQGYGQNGEVLQREKIVETSIDDINIYQGPKNQSVVLIGYETETYVQKSITLFNPSYRAVVSGKIRYRLAEPDINLNPGDIVTIDSDEITIESISYAVSAKTNLMEIVEV